MEHSQPRRSIAALVALAAGLALAAGHAGADPLLAQIRAEAETVSPLDFAVTRVYTDNSGKTRHRLARFDPTRPEGQRWSLLERNHGEPDPDYRRRYESNDRPPPESYARVARFLDGEIRRIGETDTHAIYAIERFGEGSILLEGEDISAHFSGEMRVRTAAGRPFVEEVRFRVAEPFKPHFLAKVKEGEGVIRFARTEQGRPVIRLREFSVRGSKLFGSLDYAVATRYRDHRYVGRTAAATEPVEEDS